MPRGLDRELVLGVYLAMAGGVPSFAFSSFADTIKTKHGYSPSEVNAIGSLMQAGVWTAVLGGIIVDRYGPKAAAAASMVLGCSGYTVMYFLTRGSAGVSWVLYGVAAYCCGQGGAYCYLIALKTCQSQCGEALRGRVVGALATWVSLAAGIFTILGQAFFDGDSFFLLLLAGHAFQASIGFFMRTDVGDTPPKVIRRVLLYLNVAAFVTAVMILTAGFVSHPYIFGIAMFCCLGTPLLILLATRALAARHESLSPLSPAGVDSKTVQNTAPPPQPPKTRKRLAFMEGGYLLFAYMLVFGPCAACLNILSAFVISRADLVEGETYVKKGEGEKVPGLDVVTTLLTTFAVTNTLGRIVTGILTDKYREGVRRAFWFVFWGVISALALFTLAEAETTFLQVTGVGLLGLGVGGIQTVVPQLTAEVFGMKYFAIALSCMAFAPSTGSLVFGAINASFEEAQLSHSYVFIAEKNSSDPVKYCFGDDCLKSALSVSAVTSLTGALLGITLWKKLCLYLVPVPAGYVAVNDADHDDEEEEEDDRSNSAGEEVFTHDPAGTLSNYDDFNGCGEGDVQYAE
eukprot:TRINITY_DN4471_c0_g1_i2.p1 TRINITY_DN4471_c0_g1~~TRINITY_DN4471_c0_g1_i2.p1  ORF type:complete len:573 (+),score=41.06 TRINITY_DN4471_c0_g1_i2:84-1802(+)